MSASAARATSDPGCEASRMGGGLVGGGGRRIEHIGAQPHRHSHRFAAWYSSAPASIHNRGDRHTMTPKALRVYFDVLCMFADAPVARVDDRGHVDFAKVRGLFEAGCLIGRDCSDITGRAYEDVSLSAHGAAVLAQWQAMIERDTLRTRLLATLDKLIWLVAGAALSTLPQWWG